MIYNELKLILRDGIGALLAVGLISICCAMVDRKWGRDQWLVMGVVGLFFMIVAAIDGVFKRRAQRAAQRAEQKRIETLERVTTELGLSLRPGPDHDLPKAYAFLNPLRLGECGAQVTVRLDDKGFSMGVSAGDDSRWAGDILEGSYEGWPIRVLTYHYITHSRDSRGHT